MTEVLLDAVVSLCISMCRSRWLGLIASTGVLYQYSVCCLFVVQPEAKPNQYIDLVHTS